MAGTIWSAVMQKVVVIYGSPNDPKHFRDHYEKVHVPLVKLMPNILKIDYSLNIRGFDNEFPFCFFECYFADEETMMRSMDSPQGRNASADVANFATGTFQMFHYPVGAHSRRD